MRINEITIGRKFNLGNFESLEVRVSVAPDPEDTKEKTWEEAVQALTKEIHVQIEQAGNTLAAIRK